MKNNVFKIALIAFTHLDYFYKKILHQKLSKLPNLVTLVIIFIFVCEVRAFGET